MRRARFLVALALLVVLVPVVAWWTVGDVSEDLRHPDHLFQPLSLSPAAETVIGVAASALALVAGILAGIGARSGEVRPRELLGAVPLVAAGAFLGLSHRVLTAGVGGANIGGGMVLLFGPVVLGALLLLAGVLWWSGPR